MLKTKAKPAATKTVERLIRDPEFARRLSQACDGSGHCPPMHYGRLTWIRDQFTSRFKESITTETVRKWMAGESVPRPDKMSMLAELLQVDVAWLQLGVDQNMAPRERKVRNAMADGAVNVIAGFIQMDGGHPAFPDKAGPVDLHAIIKGAKYDIHVSLASEEAGGKEYSFPVSAEVDETVIVLGVIRSGLRIDVVELSEELIAGARGAKRGGSVTVVVGKSEAAKLRRFEDFSRRL